MKPRVQQIQRLMKASLDFSYIINLMRILMERTWVKCEYQLTASERDDIVIDHGT